MLPLFGGHTLGEISAPYAARSLSVTVLVADELRVDALCIRLIGADTRAAIVW